MPFESRPPDAAVTKAFRCNKENNRKAYNRVNTARRGRINAIVETIKEHQRKGTVALFAMPSLVITQLQENARLGSVISEDTMAAISASSKVQSDGIELVAFVPLTDSEERGTPDEPQSMIYAQLGAISLEQIDHIVGGGQILFNSSQKS